jgi:hypothetical protein
VHYPYLRIFASHPIPFSAICGDIADLANAAVVAAVVVISAVATELRNYLVREVPLADATEAGLIGEGSKRSIGEDGERAEDRSGGPHHVLWLGGCGRQTLGGVSRWLFDK